ncbi:MAG TPA: chemotaxis protein CheD [Bryobacteraceae bacterium]|nr:chemotaxis protein CheD [Bryobacteraceae bacterium]
MEQIVVGMADCRVGHEAGQVLATYALGSCIGLAVHDPEAAVGGLLHFMLPDSSIDPLGGKENPCKFADTGIPLLIEEVCRRGASKRRLVVAAAGGAQMLDSRNVFDIGRRNYQAMRKLLWKAGLLLQAEAIGGDRSRTVRLEVGSGRFWQESAGERTELIAGRPRKGAGHVVPSADRR